MFRRWKRVGGGLKRRKRRRRGSRVRCAAVVVWVLSLGGGSGSNVGHLKRLAGASGVPLRGQASNWNSPWPLVRREVSPVALRESVESGRERVAGAAETNRDARKKEVASYHDGGSEGLIFFLLGW